MVASGARPGQSIADWSAGPCGTTMSAMIETEDPMNQNPPSAHMEPHVAAAVNTAAMEIAPDATQYLLSIMQPDGPPPEPAVLGPIMAAVEALGAELRTAGAWVLSCGLTPPHMARVARPAGAEVVLTDGPFAQSKEHVGGFWIIRARSAEEAIQWAAKAARATTLQIEIRELAYSIGA